MPGEISQELLSIVLSELPDDLGKITKSPDIIYSKLLRHEKRLVEEFLVQRAVLTITVPAGTDPELDLNNVSLPGSLEAKIYRIIGFVKAADVLHDFYRIDDLQRKLIFRDSIARASYTVKLMCAFGLTDNHVINATTDPELLKEFHYYLSDYVINDYAPAIKKLLGYYNGKTKQEIDQEVRMKAEVLWTVDEVSSFYSQNNMDF